MAGEAFGLDPYLGTVLEEKPHHGRRRAGFGDDARELEQPRGLCTVDTAQP